MTPELKIVKMTQETPYSADGTSKAVYVVTFALGNDGPFTERFPVEDFDLQTAKDMLEQRAQQLLALRSSFS